MRNKPDLLDGMAIMLVILIAAVAVLAASPMAREDLGRVEEAGWLP